MSHQSNFAFKTNAASKPTRDDDMVEIQIGKVLERLPRAPSIESDVTVKQRCFKAVYDRLRPKLIASGGEDTADVLIAAMSKHFPLNTLTAEEEARRIVHKFRNGFGDVNYLQPLSFIDREGINRTSSMHKTPRPANVCHVGVEARIPMGDLTETMEGKTYVYEYFLPLRQSYEALEDDDLISTLSHTPTVSTNILGNAADLDDVLFSSSSEPPRKKARSLWDTVKKLHSAESIATTRNPAMTPTQWRQTQQDILQGNNQTPESSSRNSPTATPTTEAPADTIQDATVTDETSNNSLDMELLFKNPKAAALVMQSRVSSKKGTMVCTYHGTIGIFDSQASFRREIPHWMDKYQLDIGPNGKRSEVNRKSVRNHISQYCDAIQFRVFCAEFARAYVGSYEENEHATALAIADCGRRLERIKMRYYDKSRQQMVTTTPDTVFKLMITHVGLLPENATDWPFCLPWLFFQALPDNLQDEMRRDKYILPKPAELSMKTDQLKKLMDCRDAAKNCYDKLKDLKLTVDRAVLMTTEYSSHPQRTNHVTFTDQHQHHQANDVFFNREEETYSDIPSANRNNTPHQITTAPLYRYGPQLSRAEETIQAELRKKRALELCPPDFVQRFHETNDGSKFPYHPTGQGFSKRDINFRGCFACGDTQHRFGPDCQLSNTPEGKKTFNFELHCHKPGFFFKRHRTQDYTRGHHDNLPPPSISSMGRGRGAVVPAWQSRNHQQPPSSQQRNNPYTRTGDKSSSQYVIKLQSCTMRDNTLRRMPIDSQNELPHVRFPIGTTEDIVTIIGLYDTGAALNTGLLSYHKLIMKKQPELVAEYEEFNGSNPFDPIKLCGAITNPEMYDEQQHGVLTAVIRYRTPFVFSGSKTPVTLSIALGKDVTVDTIFGLPFIASLEMEFRFRPQPCIVAHTIEREFSTVFRETVCTNSTCIIPHNNSNLGSSAPISCNTNTSANLSVPAFLHQPLLHYMPTTDIDTNNPTQQE